MKATRSNAKRILVIDDEEVVHASLRRILGRLEHRVDCAGSGAEALARLREADYDLVITDLIMPGMDGLQLLARMGAQGASVPLLMITGFPTIRTAIQALRLGAIDYVAKPFTRRELLSPVNRALRRGRREPAPTGYPRDPEPWLEPSLHPATFTPGDRVLLPGHSWATCRPDGWVDIGIEASFLQSAGPVEAIELPTSRTVLAQGEVGIRLSVAGDELHGVFNPLSGEVLETNDAVCLAPAELTPTTWLVRMAPTQLEVELPFLVGG